MKIIKNPHVLTDNYHPTKLPYRDELIKTIESKVKLGVGNLLLIGDTGCGKTESVNYIISKNKDIIFVFVNCSIDNTYGAIVKRVISVLKKVRYVELGKSRSSLAEDFIKVISNKNRKKKVVYVFDEIDKLLEKERNHQEVLVPLLENTDSNIILISNRNEALKNLDSRTLSRLNPQRYSVKRYDCNEILNILELRAKEGLKRNSWDREVIAKISKICYDTTGDIRDGLSILFETSQIAENQGKKLSLKMVDEANAHVQEIKLEKALGDLTKHQIVIVVGIAKLSMDKRKGFAELNELYNFYILNLRNESVKPVERKQFENLLSKLELRGIIKREFRYMKNYQGRVSLITLTYPPEDILKIYWEEVLLD